MFKLKNAATTMLMFLAVRTSFGLGSGALGNATGVSANAAGHGYAYAGVADDASAIHYNPAGLTQLKGLNIMTGATLLDVRQEHVDKTGRVDRSASNTPILPYLYMSYSQDSSRWAAGVGLNSPFGLASKWKDNSFSKYFATTSKIYMYSVNPCFAFNVNNELSVGLGLDFFNVYKTELNQLIPGASDGHAKLTGDGNGWGYNAAALWKITSKHSIGVSYRSEVDVAIDGKAELSDVSAPTNALLGGASSLSTNAETKVKFPRSALLGYGFKPTEKTTIFMDYEWVGWSTTNKTQFSYSRPNLLLPTSINRQWRNSNNLGIGAEFKANKTFTLRTGGLVYERVIPSGTLDSTIPDSSRYLLGFGTAVHLGSTTIDLAYDAIFFNRRKIDNDAGNSFASMDGEFKSFVNVYNVGISRHFN